MQSTQTASLDSCKCPCFCVFDCCFIQQFLLSTPLAKLTRNPEKKHCVTFCDLVVCLGFFSVNGNPYNGLTDMEGEGEEEYNFVQQSLVEETYATLQLAEEASSYSSNSDDYSVGRKNVSKYCQQRCSLLHRF